MGAKTKFKVGDRVHYAEEFFGTVTEIIESEPAGRKIYIVAVEDGEYHGFQAFLDDEITLAPIELREDLHDFTTYDA
jgi:hypothetical protein